MSDIDAKGTAEELVAVTSGIENFLMKCLANNNQAAYSWPAQLTLWGETNSLEYSDRQCF